MACDLHRSFKLNRAAKNVRSLHECRILSNIKQVERFVLSCFLVSPTLDSFKLFMKHKRSQNAFRNFTAIKSDFFFYSTLRKLNSCKNSAVWLKQAAKIFTNYIAVVTPQRNVAKVSMPSIPLVARSILMEIFTGMDMNNLTPLPKDVELVARNAFETCEAESELCLAKTVHEFVGSHQYFLWRIVERGHAVGLTAHDIVEKENVIIEKENDRPAVRNGSNLFKSITKRSARIMESLVGRISRKSDRGSSRMSDVEMSEDSTRLVAEDVPKLFDYHPHSCDAWLGVLLESSKFLPVGLALHGVVGPLDSSTSSTRPEREIDDSNGKNKKEGDEAEWSFPYLFVNETYASSCGGFTAAEMYKMPHDFMYLHQTQEIPTVRQLKGTDSEEKLVLADVEGHSSAATPTEENNNGSSEVDDGKVSSPARYSFSFCHSQNIQGLELALVGCKTIITSVPMRYRKEHEEADILPAMPLSEEDKKNQSGKGVERQDGYVSVCAWKPLKTQADKPKKHHRPQEDLDKRSHHANNPPDDDSKQPECVYYVCLQISVPVAEIYYGLTYMEAQKVCVAIKHLNSLVDMIPETLDPNHYGRPL